MNLLREIYFVNANKLAEEFSKNAIPELLAFKHFLVGLILGGIGYEVPLSVEFTQAEVSWFRPMDSILVFLVIAVITYYGTWLVYQVNQKGDGRDFFMRYAALSLPIGVQLLIIYSFVSLVMVFVANSLAIGFGGGGSLLAISLFSIVGITFVVLYFVRMRACMEIASTPWVE